jgi:probable DNA metabolism protein
VRFIALPAEAGPELPEYVAWHEPAHDILKVASQHFVGRMGRHRWMIATPLDGVYYDGEQLIHRRQCPLEWQALAQNVEDPHSAMWLTYYSHIFNPARLPVLEEFAGRQVDSRVDQRGAYGQAAGWAGEDDWGQAG